MAVDKADRFGLRGPSKAVIDFVEGGEKPAGLPASRPGKGKNGALPGRTVTARADGRQLRKLTFYLTPEQEIALRMQALQQGTSASDIIMELVQKHVVKRGR